MESSIAENFVCMLFRLYSGQVSLAIRPWVRKMSTGGGYRYCYERNGELCLTVGPVTRTAVLVYWLTEIKALTIRPTWDVCWS